MGPDCKYTRRPTYPEMILDLRKHAHSVGTRNVRSASPFCRAILDALRRAVGQACCFELSKCGTASNGTKERKGKKDQLHNGVGGVQTTRIPATAATWL